MSTPTMQPWEVRDDEARKRFEADTKDHQMTVKHADGLYRHIMFRAPDHGFYRYDLITWPGHLTICGDVETYTHARLTDMFEFFRQTHGGINPDYWSQKLQGPRRSRDLARSYSYDLYVQYVNQWLAEQVEDMDDGEAETLRWAVRDELLNDWNYARDSEHAAYQALHEFEACGRRFYDVEAEFREYDPQYLWCLWAIVRGIETYIASGPSEGKS